MTPLEPITELRLVQWAWIPAFAGMTQQRLSFPWERDSRRVGRGAHNVLEVGLLGVLRHTEKGGSDGSRE